MTVQTAAQCHELLPFPSAGPDRVRVVQLVATGTNGGAQEHVTSLLRGLDRARYDIRVATLSGGSAVARWRASGVPVDVIDSPGDEAAVAAVADRLAAWPAHVVHAHMFRAEIVAARAVLHLQARELPRPWLIGHLHSSRVRDAEDRAAISALDPSIDRLVAVSRAIEAKIRTERPARPPVRLIPNGVDVDRFAGAAPAVIEGDGSGPLVGCVARLEPEKGHETLLHAWADVLRLVPEARLMVVGEGSRLDGLRALAAARALPEDRVVFTGWRDDIPALTRAFDIAVLPSHREAQGLAILEAMAAARPVVASRVGGIVEMVQDGTTGLLVPPGDADALADAIVRLLLDREAARRLGRAGQAVARERFGVEGMLADIANLYDEGAVAWVEGVGKARLLPA